MRVEQQQPEVAELMVFEQVAAEMVDPLRRTPEDCTVRAGEVDWVFRIQVRFLHVQWLVVALMSASASLLTHWQQPERQSKIPSGLAPQASSLADSVEMVVGFG